MRTRDPTVGGVEAKPVIVDKDDIVMDVEPVRPAEEKDDVQSPSKDWQASRPSLAAFVAGEASQTPSSQTVAPSPTQRRSKEEIEKRKEAALALVRVFFSSLPSLFRLFR